MNSVETVKVEFSPNRNFQNFPIFLDYDLVNVRPRGISILLDIFYNEFIFETLNSIPKIKEPIFIKKDGFFLTSGFFLIDFKKSIYEKKFTTIFNNQVYEDIFIEKSHFLDYDILSQINKHVHILEFY